MIRFLYNFLLPLGLIVALPRYLVRMFRRGGFKQDFGQRFARYSPEIRVRFGNGDWIWVHAVSVGELLVALKVIDELHRRHPDWHFVISNTTSTAHAIALSKQKDWLVAIYGPLDVAAFVRRAFDTVRPRAVVLTESEMWPNFIWDASRRQIPILLINARVSPRSERRLLRFAPIVKAATRHLSAIGLQEPGHTELWRRLGVPASRLHVTGSVKFDPADSNSAPRDFRPILTAWGFGASDPVILAGSTHRGEEALMTAVLRRLKTAFPRVKLILVPRHAERASEIVAELSAGDLRVALRSAAPDGSGPDVLLVDTTGELRDWYACADCVFIGKSITGRGGQNPVEAIMAGRPVNFGPHMENFADLRDNLLKLGGAVEVSGEDSLLEAFRSQLADGDLRKKTTEAALLALKPHRGAVARTADLIEAAVQRE
ncbi:MAG: 3-deoxy-D-manno-octulosonic acid transferase [Chthoniobacterales bacterium]|nr:3-deoxy-D-manno-octulosonic acid transferase [Chthoniobacterales bacterium]